MTGCITNMHCFSYHVLCILFVYVLGSGVYWNMSSYYQYYHP